MGDEHYTEERRRLSITNAVGATVLTALVLATTWGDWRSFTIIAAIQGVVIPFNGLMNTVLLRRLGARRGELLRTTVNAVSGAICFHYAEWPLLAWLFLPFSALASDQSDRRLAVGIVILFCAVPSLVSLVDGVSWLYPTAFSAFAFFCLQVSAVRFATIRGMLAGSDEQRARLENAHAEVREAHEQLTSETQARAQAELELAQAQKLEAVGRLAAGIAHEINTPVQFVGDSLHFLRDASRDLLDVIDKHQEAAHAVARGEPAEPALAVAANTAEDLDLPYLTDNIPTAFARALDGLQRIAVIVRSMKDFAHPDRGEMEPVELNSAISSTLTIARGEYKHVAELEARLEPLPPVTCLRGEVNQVVLNLVINAAHAVADAQAARAGAPGRIRVQTRVDGDHVVISVGDNGTGIPEAVRARIFEPFFTTKDVGRGTGQGLAIARAVAQKHGGSIAFETELGAGTTFHLRLPVDGGAQQRAAA